jgi:prophage regulatory protein
MSKLGIRINLNLSLNLPIKVIFMSDLQERIMRYPHLKATTGLSRSTIWRLERDGNFPKRIQLSKNAVGWKQSEVSQWLQSRTAA